MKFYIPIRMQTLYPFFKRPLSLGGISSTQGTKSLFLNGVKSY
jgi:hypothetical protein